MEKKVINYSWHEHPLILTENVSTEKESSPNCYGCGKRVANLEMAYVCMEQDCSNMTILHKKCGELPSQISHPRHPHRMNLFDFRELSVNWCDICGRDIGVIGYRCSSCDFDVDTTCVDAFLEEVSELQHPGHLDHPLRLVRKPAFSFLCDGCGAEDVDMAYICSACEFMVHKSCALLPTILPTDDQFHQHHHPLSLVFSIPKEHCKYKYTCDVCDKHFDRSCWVYFCGDCRFFLHLKCVGSTTKPYSNSSEDEDGGSDVIEFPLHANDIYKKLITHFVMRETGVDHDHIPDTKDLSNYHDHPLSLVSKLCDKDDGDEESEFKICEVCVTPIFSPPYYECSACKYLIHPICSFLPITLHSSSNPNSQLCGDCQQIPNKNHNFTLYPTSRSKGRDAISYWKCDLCDCFTNGMGYKCVECWKKIDVKCASLPTTMSMRHKSHKQLVLTSILPGGTRKKCRVCRYSRNIAYCCSDDNCDFALCLICVLLPKSITEPEWDKHPLLLTFDASRDHPSDFYCEFCEEKMFPKWCMYHCRQCDASFHRSCLEKASGCYRNVKLGRQYELDGIHPNHPLTFTYITLKKRCDVCGDDVYTYLGLECASCYYVVCKDCGGDELEKISVC